MKILKFAVYYQLKDLTNSSLRFIIGYQSVLNSSVKFS